MTDQQQHQARSEGLGAACPAGVPADRARFGRIFRWARQRPHGPIRNSKQDPEVVRAYELAQYAADLSRLARRTAVLRSRASHDGQHLRAAMTAYDQTLLIAAAALGHATDLYAPLTPVDRLAVEADLTLAGLRWTSAGPEDAR